MVRNVDMCFILSVADSKTLETEDQYFVGLIDRHSLLMLAFFAAFATVPATQTVWLIELLDAILKCNEFGVFRERQVDEIVLLEQSFLIVAITAFIGCLKPSCYDLINQRFATLFVPFYVSLAESFIWFFLVILYL